MREARVLLEATFGSRRVARRAALAREPAPRDCADGAKALRAARAAQPLVRALDPAAHESARAPHAP